MAGNTKTVENISEVILRILDLEDVFDLDYETYYQILREKLIKVTTLKEKIPSEEVMLLQDEIKKVKGKTGRFVIRKKKISKKNITTFNIQDQKKLKLNKEKFLLPPGSIDNVKEIEDKSKIYKKSKSDDVLLRISKILDSILKTLIDQNKAVKKSTESQRKSAESKKRKERESELETRPLEVVKNAIQKITKPFQSILDTIINFFTNVLLGKIAIKLLDWFSKKENQDKVRSIIRFFKDWWPLLLAAYLRFGTGVGRLAGKLTSILIRGSIKLLAATARLLAASKLKGFRGISRFLSGRGGRALATGLEVGATVAGTVGLSSLLKNVSFNESPQNVGVFGGGKIFRGMVRGKKGIDKIPAMLSDGEFVMSAGAVKKHGVETFEALNASGGGTNIPLISDNMTYAAGGGLATNSPDFWSLAAISAKEAGGFPQGQSDVAQSIYNRAQMGIYPGGKSIKKIITAAGQYQPTFSNPGAWNSIINRDTAAKAVGNDYVSRLNMAAKSITNPKLQKESAKFVGSRTDFRGESQKKHMDKKKGDITRGGGHNFFGWMTDNAYNSKLPKPAPVPSIIPSQALPATKDSKDRSSFRPFGINLSNPFSSFGKKQDAPKAIGGMSGFIPSGQFGKNGEVKESTGQYHKGGGADRRLVSLRLQPGEFFKVFTKKFAERGGMNIVEYLESLMNPNSNAHKKNVQPPKNRAKISKNTSRGTSIPSIARRSRPKIIVLNQPGNKNNQQISSSASSSTPSFSATHPRSISSVSRQTYGIMV